MIEVYIKGNEDYESNGDMTLTPTMCEVELTVEGVAELTLEHPIDELGRWEYLIDDNVIAAPTPYSEKQLFRIYDYTKTETEVTAYARHIFYDSAGEMLLDVRPTEKTGQEALDIILNGTKYKAKTNIKKRATAYYVRKNIMEAISGDDDNSYINRWGGERMYDNFTVIINDRLGGDYGACAEFGRNMTGIEADVNIDDVVTRIIPQAYNGYTLNEKEPWVDSPIIGNYANPRAAVVKFEDVKLLEDCQEDEEGFETLELLREELKRRCEKEFENGLDKPKANYKVDMIEVSDTDDYKAYKELTTIGIGDDVLVRDKTLKINVMARCIRLKYDCIEKTNIEVEIGNYTENYFDKTTSAANKIEKITRADGTVKAEEVYGKIDAVKAQLKAQRDISQPSQVRAMLFEDLVKDSPTYGAMSIGTMGFCIASERTADGKDWDWKTFGTGRGFYADYICVGELDGGLIKAGSIQAESLSIEYRDEVEGKINTTKEGIDVEVKRAKAKEEELDAAIKVNAESITTKVAKGEMQSYITQYYDSVLYAFNQNSKYVQITAGQIAIYNGDVSESGKRSIFDQSGNSFYRDNYYVGAIGTNQWKENNKHKGLVFDLEYQGKYMAWARKENAEANEYETILCYSRENSIYTQEGLHTGCDIYMHGWKVCNADLRDAVYGGYNGWKGEIPIITKIQNNGDGTITWWTSSITVNSGGIISAPGQ